MQTRREYAVSLGLAKMTRGRMGKEAKDAISKAENEGVKFSDSPSVTIVKNDDGTETKKESTPTENYFGPTPDPRYPNDNWHVAGNKKMKVSQRAACANCRYSLLFHICDAPAALAGSKIEEVVYGG